MKLRTKKFKWKYDLTKHKNLLNNFLLNPFNNNDTGSILKYIYPIPIVREKVEFNFFTNNKHSVYNENIDNKNFNQSNLKNDDLEIIGNIYTTPELLSSNLKAE